MPIQYRKADTITEVEGKLRAFEHRYKLSSEEFAAHPVDFVPEFDAIEWSFLLMQRQAFQEDDCRCAGEIIWSSHETSLRGVDDVRTTYDKLAA